MHYEASLLYFFMRRKTARHSRREYPDLEASVPVENVTWRITA
jgi:hypothetical protein